jgi:hypothetical protein
LGRPTILTPELKGQIVDLVSLGNYPLIAARACGVADATFYQWLARGRNREEGGSNKAKERGSRVKSISVDGHHHPDIFVQLVEEIEKAEGFVEAKTVGRLVVAAQNDPKWSMNLLERRFPQRWRQHVTTEMVGPDGGPIQQQIETKDTTPDLAETLAGVLEALARAGKLPS